MNVVVALGLALVSTLSVCAGCSHRGSKDTDGLLDKSRVAQQRLGRLAECGICLNPGMRLGELLAEFDPTEPKERQYLALLAAMGSPLERERRAFPSDAIFTLELDCIQEPGDYAFIARRLRTLARGKLPLTRIEDHVSRAEKKAWVAFNLGTRRYRWEARVQGTRVDHDILVKFADLLNRKNSEVRFISVGLGAGAALIGCATNREMRCLRDLGVPARWLQ